MMAGVFDLELHDAENDRNDESSDDAIEVDEQVSGQRWEAHGHDRAASPCRARTAPLPRYRARLDGRPPCSLTCRAPSHTWPARQSACKTYRMAVQRLALVLLH